MFWFIGAEKQGKNIQKKAGIEEKINRPAIFEDKVREP